LGKQKVGYSAARPPASPSPSASVAEIVRKFNQESSSLFNPRELQLNFRLLTALFFLAETGAGFGVGISFLDLLTLEKDEASQVLMDGSVLTNAAYGTLTAVGLGLMFEVILPLLDYLGSRYFYEVSWYHYPKLDYGTAEPRMERQRVFYRISPSRLSSWYFRSFLAAKAFGFLGASLLSYVLLRYSYPAMVGELAGYGFGVMIGAMLGLMMPPLLGRFLARYFSGDPAQQIQDRLWYRECRHDVTWYLRLFIGTSVGYVGFSLFSDPWADQNFQLNRLMTVVVMAAMVWASPLFFAFFRLMRRSLSGEQEFTSFKAEFRQRALWSEASPIEMPWYARLCFIVLMMITLYDAFNSQISRSHQIGLITASVLLVSSPLLSFLTRNVCNRIGLKKLSKKLENGPVVDLNISRDLAWYVRAFFGMLAGSLLVDALYYYQSEEPSQESWSVVLVMTLLALTSPMLRAGVEKMGIVNENARNYSLPWYIGLGGALLFGALLGTAVGTLFPQWTQGQSFVFGYIGPDWLNISNEPLAPMGALIASGAYLLQTVVCWGCQRRGRSQYDQSSSHSEIKIEIDSPSFADGQSPTAPQLVFQGSF